MTFSIPDWQNLWIFGARLTKHAVFPCPIDENWKFHRVIDEISDFFNDWLTKFTIFLSSINKIRDFSTRDRWNFDFPRVIDEICDVFVCDHRNSQFFIPQSAKLTIFILWSMSFTIFHAWSTKLVFSASRLSRFAFFPHMIDKIWDFSAFDQQKSWYFRV